MTADDGPGHAMEGTKVRRGLSKDALLWGGVLLGAAALGVFLLRNLGTLSLWMDEGFHYLSVQSILERGVPIFPSGHAYFKAILYCYALAGLAAVGGLNAFTLRLGSGLCYAALIPVVYLVVKRYATRTAALVTAAALAFSVWGVEYARAALYFAPLQLVMVLAFYAFYRGYFEDRPRAKVWAWILFLIVPHIHQLGEAAAFAFVALLLLKGLKRFLRRDSLLFAAVIFVYFAAIQLWEFFGWQVGYVYERTDTSVGGLIKYFFSSFSMAYFREFARAFPVMSLLVLGGAFFLLSTMIWNRSRASESSSSPAASNDPDMPWAYFYLCLLFPLLFLGFFRTHVQPRYLTPLYPLFVILFVDACRRLAPGAVRLLIEPFVRLRAEKTRRIVSGAAFLALAFVAVEGVGPRRVANIVNRRYQSQ
jgi:4-amino-4-deoxy-L-arabinose transferase-like glycosyltransferase